MSSKMLNIKAQIYRKWNKGKNQESLQAFKFIHSHLTNRHILLEMGVIEDYATMSPKAVSK